MPRRPSPEVLERDAKCAGLYCKGFSLRQIMPQVGLRSTSSVSPSSTRLSMPDAWLLNSVKVTVVISEFLSAHQCTEFCTFRQIIRAGIDVFNPALLFV